MLEEPNDTNYNRPLTNELATLRIKHLEQKVAMLEAQNQELTAQIFGES